MTSSLRSWGERNRHKVRGPSPTLTSSTTSGTQQVQTSTPSWQDVADKSLGRGLDKSQAKKVKKKSRVRKLSSRSSGTSSDSGEGSGSDSNSKLQQRQQRQVFSNLPIILLTPSFSKSANYFAGAKFFQFSQVFVSVKFSNIFAFLSF